MRTNRERARLVHERTAALRREMRARRRRRLNAVCMAACLLLVTGIGALMPTTTASQPPATPTP